MKRKQQKIKYNRATELRFLQSGEEYFSALLEIINNAEKLIYLQVYTLDPDDTGNAVIQALEEAAGRGVKVFVLLDAYGSKAVTKKQLKEMQHAGIHCRRFSPIVFLKFRAGRRLHHKITVVDNHTAIIGGINISDKYRGDDTVLPWLDFGLYVSGMVAMDLQKLCERMYYPDTTPSYVKRLKTTISDKGKFQACVVHSDWFRRTNKINYHFKQAIRHSKTEIVIICSYFIPSFRLISLLKSASRRGIHIRLYLQGKSDVPIVRNATRFFYRIFFKHKMEIFEFPDRILHGKLWMVDDKILSVGSFNFNHLSEYTSVETNMQIANEEFCAQVKEELDEIFNKYAEAVPEATFLKKLSSLHRFQLWISYTITTVLMKLAFAFTSKSS